MFNDVVLDNESHKIISKIPNYNGEMSREQLEFLCGLIKMYKPKKVVEIGVSAGGTTAVIMNCLNQIGNGANMYSLDCMESLYKDTNKKTGYQFEKVKYLLKNAKYHKMILGQILPQVIEDIGNDIDCVIIDTRHIVPGEILDFLCILPYLKDGAIVILHDIVLGFWNPKAVATQLLLWAVYGKKYWGGGNSDMNRANIGAIEINRETRQNVANVFGTLMMPWSYIPTESELKLYLDIYKRHYDKECLQIFAQACDRWEARGNNECKAEVDRLLETYKDYHIYIYGAGSWARYLCSFLRSHGIEPDGFVVTLKDNQKDCMKLPVYEKVQYLTMNFTMPHILFYAIKDQKAFYELAAEGISVVHIPQYIFEMRNN